VKFVEPFFADVLLMLQKAPFRGVEIAQKGLGISSGKLASQPIRC
jgi:hypothetical protein